MPRQHNGGGAKRMLTSKLSSNALDGMCWRHLSIVLRDWGVRNPYRNPDVIRNHITSKSGRSSLDRFLYYCKQFTRKLTTFWPILLTQIGYRLNLTILGYLAKVLNKPQKRSKCRDNNLYATPNGNLRRTRCITFLKLKLKRKLHRTKKQDKLEYLAVYGRASMAAFR